MSRTSSNLWLSRFAFATAGAALLLIGVGGLVTSHGVGMSVPDWPTTYGYNMFLFPPSLWVGGVFYEHSHRLVASLVGFMTVILAGWLWVKEQRAWLRRLGLFALFLVVVQGVLGGLRVTEMMNELGIFHATLAQLYLVLLVSIALFTSKTWQNMPAPGGSGETYRGLGRVYLWTGALILLQLVVAATMRHQHAGLAIPDFPTAYGRVWPLMTPEAIARYNESRTEVTALNPITAFQVGLQMVHRLLALAVLAAVSFAAWKTRRHLGKRGLLPRLALGWVLLIVVQILLGAATIWTGKAPVIATLHVAVGALTLVVAAVLRLMTWGYESALMQSEDPLSQPLSTSATSASSAPTPA